MKRILTVGLMIEFLAGIPSAQAADVTNLRCEYRENPLGIDVVKPRLSWVIEDLKSESRGEKQTAYQILVASSEELLKNDKGDLWDSGKVVSEQSVLVVYNGKPLGSWKQCHWKVRVGFPYLLRALANGGRSDVIFAMINQTDKPGYGFQLNYGATSLPEDWDYQPGNSQNHFMLGHINEWFYHDLAGIQCDPAAVGFKKIIIKPVPVGDLTWVKAHYDSLYGRIVSNWKREGAKLTMDVIIPVNTTATICVPAKDVAGVTESGKPAAQAKIVKFLRMENNAAVYEVGSGCYQFCSEMTSERKNK